MKKRILVTVVMLVVLLALIALPAQAATYEDWEFFAARNHQAYGYFTINPINLQVLSFTLVNNTTMDTLHLRIVYDGIEVIFELFCPPGETVTESINNFKFHRLPLEDPDDPGDVRYPNKIAIYVRN